MRGGACERYVPGASGHAKSGMHAAVVRVMGVVGAKAGESPPFAFAFAFLAAPILLKEPPCGERLRWVGKASATMWCWGCYHTPVIRMRCPSSRCRVGSALLAQFSHVRRAA